MCNPSPKSFATLGKCITNTNVTNPIKKISCLLIFSTFPLPQINISQAINSKPFKIFHLFKTHLSYIMSVSVDNLNTPSREPSIHILHDCLLQGQIHNINQYPICFRPMHHYKLHDLPVFDFNLLVKKTPQWLMSTDEHYQQILSSLPAPILLNASSACIPRIPSPNTQRKKESYISNILSDFTAQCSSLVSISDDNFKSWASKSSETAGKNKYQVFAYHMQCLYGDIIGSAFRELPHETKEPPDITTLTKYFKENSWVNEPLQTLME
jgi:hypothetical protein